MDLSYSKNQRPMSWSSSHCPGAVLTRKRVSFSTLAMPRKSARWESQTYKLKTEMKIIDLGHGGMLFGADQGFAVAIPAKITDLCGVSKNRVRFRLSQA